MDDDELVCDRACEQKWTTSVQRTGWQGIKIISELIQCDWNYATFNFLFCFNNLHNNWSGFQTKFPKKSPNSEYVRKTLFWIGWGGARGADFVFCRSSQNTSLTQSPHRFALSWTWISCLFFFSVHKVRISLIEVTVCHHQWLHDSVLVYQMYKMRRSFIFYVTAPGRAPPITGHTIDCFKYTCFLVVEARVWKSNSQHPPHPPKSLHRTWK